VTGKRIKGKEKEEKKGREKEEITI
jgi:hypothetical protein